MDSINIRNTRNKRERRESSPRLRRPGDVPYSSELAGLDLHLDAVPQLPASSAQALQHQEAPRAGPDPVHETRRLVQRAQDVVGEVRKQIRQADAGSSLSQLPVERLPGLVGSSEPVSRIHGSPSNRAGSKRRAARSAELEAEAPATEEPQARVDGPELIVEERANVGSGVWEAHRLRLGPRVHVGVVQLRQRGR